MTEGERESDREKQTEISLSFMAFLIVPGNAGLVSRQNASES